MIFLLRIKVGYFMNLYFIRHAEPDYDHDTITENGKEHCHCMPRRCDFSPYYSPGQHSLLPFYFAYGF